MCAKERVAEAHRKLMREKAKTKEQFLAEVYADVGEEYTVIDGEYENNKSYFTFQHNCEKCGNYKFRTKANAFLNNKTRCPVCASSKGEIQINEYLNEHNIIYIHQYSFTDCVSSKNSKYQLHFDFGILDEFGNLKMLIEYDGIQHFEPVQFGGINLEEAIEKFEETKRNDTTKNEYCKRNNIKLFRISYKNKGNIPKILNSIFKN